MDVAGQFFEFVAPFQDLVGIILQAQCGTERTGEGGGVVGAARVVEDVVEAGGGLVSESGESQRAGQHRGLGSQAQCGVVGRKQFERLREHRDGFDSREPRHLGGAFESDRSAYGCFGLAERSGQLEGFDVDLHRVSVFAVARLGHSKIHHHVEAFCRLMKSELEHRGQQPDRFVERERASSVRSERRE